MVRKMAYVGFSYLLGLLFASFFNFYVNVCLGALLLITGCIAYFADKKHISAYVCCIFFGIGSIFYTLYDFHVYDKITAFDGTDVNFYGTITEYTDYSGDMCRYEATGIINNTVKADVICFTGSHSCKIGDNIFIEGTISKPDKTFLYNSEEYYKNKGVFLEFSYPDKIEITDGNGLFIKRQLLNYRDHIYSCMDRCISHNQMAIARAMLFGDKSSIDDTAKTLLYRAGIGHIMAVSGVHLTIICSVIWFVLTLIPMNKYARVIFLFLITGIFVILSGASNSVMRAAIMIIIVYGGSIFNRRADVLNSLGIAAIILSIDCPFVVRDASFMLSFTGVIGISTVAPAVISFLEEKITIRPLFKSFLTAAAVSVTVFPVSFLYFDEISVVSPISNILLMPFCTIILICGMIVACTGGINFIALPVMKICGICCDIVTIIATAIGSVRYAQIPLGYEFISTLIITAFIIVLLITIIIRKPKAFLLSTVAVFSACIAIIMCYRFIPSDEITVTVLSNGKGSSSLVIHDKRSASVIDLNKGGQTYNYIKRYLDQRGIFIIDMLVMGVDDITSSVIYKNNFELFDIRTIVLPEENHTSDEFLLRFSDRVMHYSNNVDSVIDMPSYTVLISENNTVCIKVGKHNIIAYNGKTESGISGDFDIAIEYTGKNPARYINCDTGIYLDKNSIVSENDYTYKGDNFKIKINNDYIETEEIY